MIIPGTLVRVRDLGGYDRVVTRLLPGPRPVEVAGGQRHEPADLEELDDGMQGLREAAWKLNNLLSMPEQGLFTWHGAVARAVEAVEQAWW